MTACPVYAMCGWYRENDKDHSQYKRSIDEALEIGYRAFKVKVGRYDLDDDVDRIAFGWQPRPMPNLYRYIEANADRVSARW